MTRITMYTKWHCFGSAILLYISHRKTDGGGGKKMNANAKYPAWVFELYARYFELLAPGEEALSIDEYAECLGFKGGKEG
ncbi:hypothetical protein C5F40_00495 [Escherichia coli]|nr:hypothetical protein C5F40_00495 [Escherichia coli]PQA30698.1 hypothetical protein C5F39_00495 [Escherichia coli]